MTMKKKPGPMYRLLAKRLRSEIQSQHYRVGEHIPSERDIAQQYGVTRITARGALRELETEGLLLSEPHRCRRVIASPTEKGSIGLLFFKWQSPFADPMLADFCTGVAVQAQAMGYAFTLSYISRNQSIESQLETLDASPPRGMIVVGSYEWYGPIMSRIEAKHPTVLVGSPHGSLRADVIVPDFEGAMTLAMGHLRSMGYERVKLLAGGFPEEEGRDQRNIESFRQAGLQFGFASDKLSLFSTREVCGRKLEPHQSAGLWIDDKVLDDCRFPMAILATAPTYALKIFALAQSKDLSVPEDIAILCTQECRTLSTLPTPLTTISIFGQEVGAHAVARLDDRLRSLSTPRRMERAAVRLIMRGSCGESADMLSVPDEDPSEAHPLEPLSRAFNGRA